MVHLFLWWKIWLLQPLRCQLVLRKEHVTKGKCNLDSEEEDFMYSDEEHLNYNVDFSSFILIYLKRKQQYISNVITQTKIYFKMNNKYLLITLGEADPQKVRKSPPCDGSFYVLDS